MKRLSSQLILTENADVLRQSVIQLNATNVEYANILEDNHESAQTIFVDGILSPPVVAVSKHKLDIISIQNQGFTILNIANFSKEFFDKNKKKVIFDFETEKVAEINQLLRLHQGLFLELNSIDFISSCTVLPLLLLEPEKRYIPNRFLWMGTDLVEKKMTGQTSVSKIEKG